MPASERDRVFGCLFGLAVGDALGAPIEGYPREEVRQRYGKITDMMGGGWLKLEPGQFTDDTEMALAIVEAIEETRCIDLEAIARAFLKWKKTAVNIGGQTFMALSALERGISPEEAGTVVWRESGSWLAGNGCIMRTAPIGLYLRWATFEERGEASRKVASITHGDPRCLDACALLDHIIAHLAIGEEVPLELIKQWARGMHPSVATRVKDLEKVEMESLSTGGFVLDTLQAGVWFLLNAHSFKEGLVDAVSLGQDADTTGAVTGALLGSKFGVNSIPGGWLDKLKDKDKLNYACTFLYEQAPR